MRPLTSSAFFFMNSLSVWTHDWSKSFTITRSLYSQRNIWLVHATEDWNEDTELQSSFFFWIIAQEFRRFFFICKLIWGWDKPFQDRWHLLAVELNAKFSVALGQDFCVTNVYELDSMINQLYPMVSLLDPVPFFASKQIKHFIKIALCVSKNQMKIHCKQCGS